MGYEEDEGWLEGWFLEYGNIFQSKREFPCPRNRLETYVIGIEKNFFKSLSERLISFEEFYVECREKANMLMDCLLKEEKIMRDPEKLKISLDKIVKEIYELKKLDYFNKRELRTLLNLYRDDSYRPFKLSSNPNIEEKEEFERQRIVSGLRSHVLGCEGCRENYMLLLKKLSESSLSFSLSEDIRQDLEKDGLLELFKMDVAKKIDCYLLSVYKED